ncbi:MAG: 3-keto-5-aminohexanoate cleavage protein [Clostridiales Family XIII bacterium]|nr:3-keto-5-aminohexanoate cleavage protein [Clostridiales Family XIII bacterium]
MSDLSKKTIITVATTGAWPKKTDTPYVPIEPAEIAEEVYACWKAGAAVAHIHVRDAQANASMDFDNFKKTVELIRAKKDCDIIINLTTSGGIGLTEESRMKPFYELKPEMASYDSGTMNWQHNSVFENNPAFLEKLAIKMNEVGVKPEIEIFDVGMIYEALYYVKKGVLKPPLHFQFCLGVAGGMPATVENLVFLKNLIPEGSTWSTFGVGGGAQSMLFAALALGGNVRVGMEDNVFYLKGQLAKSNVEFVERVKRLVHEYGKEVATPDEARQILSLK